MRRLYADISPGLGWDGRDPEALLAATATQTIGSTVTVFLAAGAAALLAHPGPIAFLVGGTTPAHAPVKAVATGTDEDDAALVETVTFRASSSGQRVAGATTGKKNFKTLTNVTYTAGSGVLATVAIGLGLPNGTRDVRGKIRFEYLIEALKDPARPGMLDELMVDTLGINVAGLIDGKLGAPNGNYDVPFDLKTLGDLGRLGLDLWVAEAGKDHPTVIVVDHVQLRKDAEREIEMIREALAGIGEKPPDPAKNVGGDVGSIGAEAKFVPPPSFTSSLGDFA